MTAGQLGLAWVLAKVEDLVPIPGTKRRKYLKENTAAGEIKLAPAEVADLEAAVPQNEMAGERYAATNMKTIDRQSEVGNRKFGETRRTTSQPR